MSLTNKEKKRSGDNRSVLNTVIRRTSVQKDAPFITEDHIPAGKYRTEIVGVFEARTEKGKAAVDLVYSFTNEDGFGARAKERYVADGYRLEQLCDHWITSGLLEEDVTYSDLKGIVENVTVFYGRKGALGSLLDLRPCKIKSAMTVAADASDPYIDEDEEDDYDDFLPSEDDD